MTAQLDIFSSQLFTQEDIQAYSGQLCRLTTEDVNGDTYIEIQELQEDDSFEDGYTMKFAVSKQVSENQISTELSILEAMLKPITKTILLC